MPSNPFTDPQWASRTVDTIDRIVAFVRDRTTRPAVAIVGAIFVVIVLVIGGIRALHSLLDIWWSRDTAVWASYLIIGGVFCVIVMLLMRRRHPQD